MHPLTAHLRRRSGFTLIELLIVMIVLGILFVMGLFLFNDVRDSAEKTKMRSQLRAAYTNAKAYQVDHGQYGSGVDDAARADVLNDEIHESGFTVTDVVATDAATAGAGAIDTGAACGDGDGGTNADDFIAAPADDVVVVCVNDAGTGLMIAGSAAGQTFNVGEAAGAVIENL